MKFATISKALVMGLVLLLASGAFAADKANLTLQHKATVNGTQLKPGDYKLVWEGSGDNVQVSIMQGKKVVAKAPAKVVELGFSAPNDAAVFNNDGDGRSTLAGFRFYGKTYGLELTAPTDNMQAGSGK